MFTAFYVIIKCPEQGYMILKSIDIKHFNYLF